MNRDALSAIFPDLKEDELERAGEALDRYFKCALKIIHSDPAFVDNTLSDDTIKERSNSSLKNKSFEHG